MGIKVELNDSMSTEVEGLARVMGVTPVEALERCFNAAKSFLTIMTPVQEQYSEETMSTAPQAKAWVRLDGVLYENKSFKGLCVDVLKALGCKKVFDSYPEDGVRQLIFNHRPEEKDEARGDYIQDGKYRFWVYTNLSQTEVRKFINTIATSLNISIELP